MHQRRAPCARSSCKHDPKNCDQTCEAPLQVAVLRFFQALSLVIGFALLIGLLVGGFYWFTTLSSSPPASPSSARVAKADSPEEIAFHRAILLAKAVKAAANDPAIGTANTIAKDFRSYSLLSPRNRSMITVESPASASKVSSTRSGAILVELGAEDFLAGQKLHFCLIVSPALLIW